MAIANLLLQSLATQQPQQQTQESCQRVCTIIGDTVTATTITVTRPTCLYNHRHLRHHNHLHRNNANMFVQSLAPQPPQPPSPAHCQHVCTIIDTTPTTTTLTDTLPICLFYHCFLNYPYHPYRSHATIFLPPMSHAPPPLITHTHELHALRT